MKSEKILDLAVSGIKFCEDGGTLDGFLDFYLKENEFRSVVSSMLFTYFRNKAVLDYAIKMFTQKKPSDFLRRVLSVVFVQILYQSGIESYAATDIAVSYVKKSEGKFAGNFINAVTRSFLRHIEQKENKNKILSAVRIVPDLLYKRWAQNYSTEKADRIVEVIGVKAPFTFRSLIPIGQDIMEKLNLKKLDGIESFNFYIAEDLGLLLDSDLMEKGLVYIQDSATIFFSKLIKGLTPERVLDYCSAPGGKTLVLSSLFPNSQIVATDRSDSRLKRVEENIQRMNAANIQVLRMEEFESECKGGNFDLVLLDVPCSNTGVIRHRPDVMWKFNLSELKSITSLQKEILERIAPYVIKGGCILYSTCSIEIEENEQQVRNFLAERVEFSLVSMDTLLPNQFNDGAFVALLRKE